MIQQSIRRPFGVNVYGSATLRTEPDYAEIDLGVVRIAPTAAAAFDQCGKAVQAARNAIRKQGVPDVDLEVSRVALNTAYEGYGPAAKFLGYRAGVSFRILARELNSIERLLSEVVAAGANEVNQVRYATSRLRELRAEVRVASIHAAQRKAEVFCEAAGVRLGRVIHIEDVNPDRGAVYRSGHEGPGEPEEESETPGALQPGSVVIQAAVMLSFSLLPD
jgi:uncharacterized protein YggE